MTLNTESLTREVKQLKKEVAYLKDIVLQNNTTTIYESEFEYTTYLEHAADELSQYSKIPRRY
tara:strand:+ start:2028 stop:2216 length:189 start_codon:yes stop_codon:yes gene_type:complete